MVERRRSVLQQRSLNAWFTPSPSTQPTLPETKSTPTHRPSIGGGSNANTLPGCVGVVDLTETLAPTTTTAADPTPTTVAVSLLSSSHPEKETTVFVLDDDDKPKTLPSTISPGPVYPIAKTEEFLKEELPHQELINEGSPDKNLKQEDEEFIREESPDEEFIKEESPDEELMKQGELKQENEFEADELNQEELKEEGKHPNLTDRLQQQQPIMAPSSSSLLVLEEVEASVNTTTNSNRPTTRTASTNNNPINTMNNNKNNRNSGLVGRRCAVHCCIERDFFGPNPLGAAPTAPPNNAAPGTTRTDATTATTRGQDQPNPRRFESWYAGTILQVHHHQNHHPDTTTTDSQPSVNQHLGIPSSTTVTVRFLDNTVDDGVRWEDVRLLRNNNDKQIDYFCQNTTRMDARFVGVASLPNHDSATAAASSAVFCRHRPDVLYPGDLVSALFQQGGGGGGVCSNSTSNKTRRNVPHNPPWYRGRVVAERSLVCTNTTNDNTIISVVDICYDDGDLERNVPYNIKQKSGTRKGSTKEQDNDDDDGCYYCVTLLEHGSENPAWLQGFSVALPSLLKKGGAGHGVVVGDEITPTTASISNDNGNPPTPVLLPVRYRCAMDPTPRKTSPEWVEHRAYSDVVAAFCQATDFKRAPGCIVYDWPWPKTTVPLVTATTTISIATTARRSTRVRNPSAAAAAALSSKVRADNDDNDEEDDDAAEDNEDSDHEEDDATPLHILVKRRKLALASSSTARTRKPPMRKKPPGQPRLADPEMVEDEDEPDTTVSPQPLTRATRTRKPPTRMKPQEQQRRAKPIMNYADEPLTTVSPRPLTWTRKPPIQKQNDHHAVKKRPLDKQQQEKESKPPLTRSNRRTMPIQKRAKVVDIDEDDDAVAVLESAWPLLVVVGDNKSDDGARSLRRMDFYMSHHWGQALQNSGDAVPAAEFVTFMGAMHGTKKCTKRTNYCADIFLTRVRDADSMLTVVALTLYIARMPHDALWQCVLDLNCVGPVSKGQPFPDPHKMDLALRYLNFVFSKQGMLTSCSDFIDANFRTNHKGATYMETFATQMMEELYTAEGDEHRGTRIAATRIRNTLHAKSCFAVVVAQLLNHILIPCMIAGKDKPSLDYRLAPIVRDVVTARRGAKDALEKVLQSWTRLWMRFGPYVECNNLSQDWIREKDDECVPLDVLESIRHEMLRLTESLGKIVSCMAWLYGKEAHEGMDALADLCSHVVQREITDTKFNFVSLLGSMEDYKFIQTIKIRFVMSIRSEMCPHLRPKLADRFGIASIYNIIHG